MFERLLLHGRKLQIGFATAHFITLAIYSGASIDLVSAGQFSAYFFLPSIVLSILVFAGCLSRDRTLPATGLLLFSVIACGAACLWLWSIPFTLLYVVFAVGSVWCASFERSPIWLRSGALVTLPVSLVLIFLCVRLPLNEIIASSERSAGDLIAKEGTAGTTASAKDFWEKAAHRGDNEAAMRLKVMQQVTADSVVATPTLTPYPSSTEALPRIELGKAIKMFMPADGKGIGWDFNVDGPIAWMTDGYETTTNQSRAQRIGLMRIDVLGKISTVLRKSKHELAWSVTYAANDSIPKFGAEMIRLSPESCFGTMYDGCMFDPRPSMTRAGISVTERCFRGHDSNGVAVFILAFPDRTPMQLLWANSQGSGGGSSWLEMRPLKSATQLSCD